MTTASSVLDRRRAGVLLHITSLPGGCGNGDLGQDSIRFVDFIAESGISVWQTLPINPTHDDGSPYQCLSAHAGNPLLIDLEDLIARGWLSAMPPPFCDASPRAYRMARLREAYQGFRARASERDRKAFAAFCAEQDDWLPDFTRFVAIRNDLGSRAWQSWPALLRDRDPLALAEVDTRLAMTIDQVKFEQWVFFSQWRALRSYARKHGVLLFGDIPIFVAGDSADVWSNRDQFDLNPDGSPRVVAGVPPDYFSATGQRWGNPHYLWDRMQADGFRWWIGRFRSQLALYDWVRIDHFRGLEAYWEIPVEAETAIDGRWVKAPGEELLRQVIAALGGNLPLIAENLGIITAEVEALRDQFDIPGMLILQFAFDGGADNPYLPANHTPNNVVYTGTHDNDTTLSWFESLNEGQQAHVFNVLGNPAVPMPLALVEAAYNSVAHLAIVPMQDFLGLGRGERMNTPGTVAGNWTWRFRWDQVGPGLPRAMAEMAKRARR